MGNASVFQRVEKKYQMSEEQYARFLQKTKELIHEDEFGLHTIHNIYFDTPNYGLIRSSLEKPKYKEKFRMRGYGTVTQDSEIFLEIKKKYQGVVYKRRTCVSYKEAERYVSEGVLPEGSDQIMREIDYFFQFYKPQPQVYLAYDRVAYVGNEDDQLRITIDRNIRSRYERLELGYTGGCRSLNPGTYLMEIKVAMAYPVWLSRILAELQIYPISFSKYGNVYANSVLSGELHPWLREAGGQQISENRKKQREKEKESCLQVYSAV